MILSFLNEFVENSQRIRVEDNLAEKNADFLVVMIDLVVVLWSISGARRLYTYAQSMGAR